MNETVPVEAAVEAVDPAPVPEAIGSVGGLFSASLVPQVDAPDGSGAPGEVEVSAEQEADEELAYAIRLERAKRQAKRIVDAEEGVGANSFTPKDAATDIVDVADVRRYRRDNDYLIKGLIYRQGVTVLHAAPNAGKSFMALDLTLSLGAGLETWGERRTVGQVKVLYFFAESVARLWKRVDAWCQWHGLTAQGLRGRVDFVGKPVDLVSQPKLIGELIELIKKGGYGLVILDPWLMCIPGGDASDAQDMMAAMSSVARIRDATEAAIMIVHHDNRSGGYLGSMALDAICDTRLHMIADDKIDDRGHKAVTIKVEKQRDDGRGELYGHLALVSLGNDTDGDEITSCVFAYDGRPRPDERVTSLSRRVLVERMYEAIRRTHNPDLEDLEAAPPSMTDFEKDPEKADLGIGGTPTGRKRALEWLQKNGVAKAYERQKIDKSGRTRTYQALRPVIGGSLAAVPAFAELEDAE